MMEKSILSICIPTYNRRAILEKKVKRLSLLTDQRIVFVIVDNCSTDGSYEMCIKYAKQDQRFNVAKNQENIGAVRNYYRCIKLAYTEYVFPSSDEDDIPFDYIDYILNVITQQKPSLIFGRIVDNYGKGKKIKDNTNFHDRVYLKYEQILKNPYFIWRPYIGGRVLRKDLIDFSLLDHIESSVDHIVPAPLLHLICAQNGNLITTAKTATIVRYNDQHEIDFSFFESLDGMMWTYQAYMEFVKNISMDNDRRKKTYCNLLNYVIRSASKFKVKKEPKTNILKVINSLGLIELCSKSQNQVITLIRTSIFVNMILDMIQKIRSTLAIRTRIIKWLNI